LALGPPHLHAQVTRFHDDRHPEGFDLLQNDLRNLRGEALLDLQTPGKSVDQARDLGQTDHFAVWNVGHVAFAEERQEMMFTKGVEINVPDANQLAVWHLKVRLVDERVDSSGV